MHASAPVDQFELQFRKLTTRVEERAAYYWRWYWYNLVFGAIVKVVSIVSLALLVSDVGLRQLPFYPKDGLLDVLSFVVGVFVALDQWWNPWARKNLFLRLSEEALNLSRLLQLHWANESTSSNDPARKINIIHWAQAEFSSIVDRAIKGEPNA